MNVARNTGRAHHSGSLMKRAYIASFGLYIAAVIAVGIIHLTTGSTPEPGRNIIGTLGIAAVFCAASSFDANVTAQRSRLLALASVSAAGILAAVGSAGIWWGPLTGAADTRDGDLSVTVWIAALALIRAMVGVAHLALWASAAFNLLAVRVLSAVTIAAAAVTTVMMTIAAAVLIFTSEFEENRFNDTVGGLLDWSAVAAAVGAAVIGAISLTRWEWRGKTKAPGLGF